MIDEVKTGLDEMNEDWVVNKQQQLANNFILSVQAFSMETNHIEEFGLKLYVW